MKRLFLIAILLVSFFATPLSAFAQTATPTPTTRRDITQLKVQDLKRRIEAKRATKSAELSLQRKDLIRTFFNRMTDRMDAAVVRLETLISRIESRIAKIKAEDPSTNLTEVEGDLTRAKTTLAEARADLAAAEANLETVLSSNNPKEAFALLKTTLAGVKSKLVQTHKTLVHLIGDIKGLRVGETTSGTPKPTRAAKPTKTVTVTVAPTI